MQLFHWQSPQGNFGDDLNLWLWDYLLPGFRQVHPEVLLVGVGTVLSGKMLPSGIRKLVVGSGCGYDALPDFSTGSEWDIRGVRGPLTARKLGLAAELGVVDPAVMVADMPEFQGLQKKRRAIFVPHWESALSGIWQSVCKAAGLTYVNPCDEAKSVIRAIAQSELVVAESMHAAILADAFRIPWVAVSTSGSINSFKWQDWASSLDLTYRPRNVPISTRAEAIAKSGRFWGLDFSSRPPEPEGDGAAKVDDSLVATRLHRPASALRSVAKQMLAAPSALALWQARRAAPQLSPDKVLCERKGRLREILAGIQRDYF